MKGPKGVQMPRLFYAPWGDEEPKGSLGQEAIDLAALAGLELDPWQQWWMRQACAVNPSDTYYNPFTKRQEPKWAALDALLIVSRQNGKGSLIEARELAGLFLFGERVLLHSAHQFATSNEAFRRIAMLIEGTPELSKELMPKSGILQTSGNQSVNLKSGQRLLFKARSGKSVRGFTGDFIVFDECMFLGAEEIGAMRPALSARPNPHIWMTGSAGDIEIGDCSHMGMIRSKALAGTGSRLLFAEWSGDMCNDFCFEDCDEHDAIDDPQTWARANPGQGIRIDPDFILSELETMEKRTFLTERLGVGHYPVEGASWQVISKDAWEKRTDELSQLEGKFALAVDVTPDWSYSCLAVCGPSTNEGLDHVEIIGSGAVAEDDLSIGPRNGTQWVVPRVLKIWKAQRPACVVIDPATPAGSFIDELVQAGVNVISPSGREFAQGCGEFRSAVVPAKGEEATIVHIGQKPLADALANADKRRLTDMWAWDKRSSDADISPLVAATLAHWGYRKHVHTAKKPFTPRFFFA